MMLVLTILGIVIPIIFGYITYKQQTKSRIFFIEQHRLNLLNDIVQSFPDLSLTYKEAVVDQKTFLLRGVFVYWGTKDAVSNDIIKGITVKINDTPSKWLSCRVKHASEGIKLKEDLVDREIEFQFDLLTNKDSIYIEALGESPSLKIGFTHRIAHVGKIAVTNIKSEGKFYQLLFFGFFLLLMAYIFYGILSRPELEEVLVDENGRIRKEEKIIAKETPDAFSEYVDSLTQAPVFSSKADSTAFEIYLLNRDIITSQRSITKDKAEIDKMEFDGYNVKAIYNLKDSIERKISIWDLYSKKSLGPFLLGNGTYVKFFIKKDWAGLILFMAIIIVGFLYLVSSLLNLILFRAVIRHAKKVVSLSHVINPNSNK
jgi:hypothetical protein